MQIRKSWGAVLALLAAFALVTPQARAKENSTPGNSSKSHQSQSDRPKPAAQTAAPTDEINRAAMEATWKPPAEVVIRNAKIMTVTHGTIANGSVLIRNGKFVEAGPNVNAGAAAKMIDAGGKIVTPGIIDAHAHMALDDDVNEYTSPVVPHMKMLDAFNYTDKAIYRALAGGVTTSLLAHGSGGKVRRQGPVVNNQQRGRGHHLVVARHPR